MLIKKTVMKIKKYIFFLLLFCGFNQNIIVGSEPNNKKQINVNLSLTLAIMNQKLGFNTETNQIEVPDYENTKIQYLLNPDETKNNVEQCYRTGRTLYFLYCNKIDYDAVIPGYKDEKEKSLKVILSLKLYMFFNNEDLPCCRLHICDAVSKLAKIVFKDANKIFKDKNWKYPPTTKEYFANIADSYHTLFCKDPKYVQKTLTEIKKNRATLKSRLGLNNKETETTLEEAFSLPVQLYQAIKTKQTNN